MTNKRPIFRLEDVFYPMYEGKQYLELFIQTGTFAEKGAAMHSTSLEEMP